MQASALMCCAPHLKVSQQAPQWSEMKSLSARWHHLETLEAFIALRTCKARLPFRTHSANLFLSRPQRTLAYHQLVSIELLKSKCTSQCTPVAIPSLNKQQIKFSLWTLLQTFYSFPEQSHQNCSYSDAFAE